jgi:hypothetical protein
MHTCRQEIFLHADIPAICSDWPFAPEEAGTYYNGYLETYPRFTPGQAQAINRTNAEALFPCLARQPW